MPATLAPAVTAPLNLAVAQSLPLDDDLPPAAGPDGLLSGSRKAAGMVGRDLTDRMKLAWNPTTENILVTGQLLHLEGNDRDVDLSWRYNSINDDRPTLSEGTSESAVTVGADNSVTYTAPDGGTYKFVPKTGGGWTTPPGLNATVTQLTSTAAAIRFNDTGNANWYENVGGVYRLAYTGDRHSLVADRNAFAYDTDGRLETITMANGRQVLFEYDDADNTGQPSTITDQALNRVITIDYDSNGRMQDLTDATGAHTGFDYSSGLLDEITDGRGNTTELSYDANDKAAEIRYTSNTNDPTVHTLDAVDATTATLTDTDNRVTTFKFNASRQITSITDPLGHVTNKTHNGHDDQLTNVNALNQTTTSTFNPNNTLANILSPIGGTGPGKQIAFTYPAATAGEAWLEFHPTSSTDSEGNVTSYTYDTVFGRPYQTITPGGTGGSGTLTNRYQGDAAATTCGALRGQLCKTIDGKGNTTSITYDAAHNPVTITRPAPLGVITNTFDAAGRIATSKDGKGQTATYVYDENDRLLQTRFGATCLPATCVTYAYDDNGNLTTRVDGSGTTTHVYDEQNRPTSKAIGGVTTSLSYDHNSNITSFTDPTGTVDYRYDDADRLTALAEPGGSCPATLVFPNSTGCTGFTYDNSDRRIGTQYPNGVKNATEFDPAGRIKTITATNTSAAVLAKRAYTYTTHPTTLREGSLRKSMTTDTGAVTTYTYDAVQRLKTAVTGTVTESWTYDLNGNRLTSAKTGATTVNYAYNAADQLCWTSTGTGTCAAPPAGASTYTFDANGNQTKAGTTTSTWNTFDQLASHTNSSTTSFTYAGQGNTERLTSGTMSFLNGSLGITRQSNASGTVSFIRDPEGNLISMRNVAGASFYYTTDALGSTILLTDGTQAKAATYLYDSWGNTTTQTGTMATVNPWRFAGGYKDDVTGYTKFGARYYGPGNGRFTQPDPSWQEANRYAYASCNPINSVDPSGLDDTILEDIGCGVTAFGTGLGGIALLFAAFGGLPGLVLAGTVYVIGLAGMLLGCGTQMGAPWGWAI
ncbi:RHS repeat domain-containing protein [Arthrobacter sp. AFG20]|uniref:RHS repeat domain-containing protein n=1 Tax=Arthrobacter sp. AFG20 TaxID=1688671 RepID=UPI000C9DC747|nr:RHS repeat-associated core domain-containing protein [Arthrobacter sp. AFG20]PNH86161.1 sugar-binding protein [Arthrobacter sp. AFG20]